MLRKTWRTDVVPVVLILVSLFLVFVPQPGAWFEYVLGVIIGACVLWLGWVLWQRPDGRLNVGLGCAALAVVAAFLVIYQQAAALPRWQASAHRSLWLFVYVLYAALREWLIVVANAREKEK